jgi:hypothetical protein
MPTQHGHGAPARGGRTRISFCPCLSRAPPHRFSLSVWPPSALDRSVVPYVTCGAVAVAVARGVAIEKEARLWHFSNLTERALSLSLCSRSLCLWRLRKRLAARSLGLLVLGSASFLA